MKLTYLTGRADAVRSGALNYLKDTLNNPSADSIIFLVPDQYTLQAEIDVLHEIAECGFFRLQVLSPRRLCQRIFEQAGSPGQIRVDEQGRVMLMHAAAQEAAPQLTWYKTALNRPGFAEKCVRQIAAFKQAGFSPEDLREIAREDKGALPHKLHDLSILYEQYEQALKGRFIDGEDETMRACERMAGTPFLQGAHVCVYGFDLITQSLRRMILSLLPVCDEIAVAVTLDEGKRDAPLFTPVLRSVQSLNVQAAALGVRPERVQLQSDPRPGALGHLERELFSIPQTPSEEKNGNVHLCLCKNPVQEAEYAAGLVRRLCRTNGWRYRDFAVVCASGSETSMDALRRAFRLYRVPLFLTQGRSADKHPLSVCLLSALSAVTRGWRLNDLTAYIRSGFSGLTDDEADILVNYAQAHGLKGKAWREPLKYGKDEEIQAAEPLREKAAAALIALAGRARAASSLEEMLAAVFALLEDIRAYDQLEERRRALEAEGLTIWAAEGIQVWNRIVEALDQMAQLLSGKKIRFEDVYEMLRRALGAAVVKALPQSPDAVEGGTIEHLRGKPVKALLILGTSDVSASDSMDLLDDGEITLLRSSGMDLGMDAQERQYMRRLGIKSLIGMTESCLLISRAQSDEAGRALQSSMLMNEVVWLLPCQTVRGGITGDDEILTVRLEQPDAALCHAPGLIGSEKIARAALKALERMDGMDKSLRRMRASFTHKVYSENLDPALARRLLAPAGTVSPTRLERFAACPFRHFADYALRPEEFVPFSLSPRDAGNFYHEALQRFVSTHAQDLTVLPPDDGQVLMNRITDELIADLLLTHAGQDALARVQGESLRRIARRAAAVIIRQFDGSRFKPACVELGIARDEVRIDGNTVLGGRIDRIDLFENEQGEKYVRVIDYKTGGRSVSLQEIYCGLQMQLILYLTAAAKQFGALPAGAFYFSVADPLVDTESRDPAFVERERDKELRLDGLVLKDEKVVAAMAKAPELAVSVSFHKDGTLGAGDKLLEMPDFRRLMRHALQTADQMLKRMRSGDTSIAPSVCSGNPPCTYCNYRTLCGWDERLKGAKLRRLQKMSADEILGALAEKDPPAAP